MYYYLNMMNIFGKHLIKGTGASKRALVQHMAANNNNQQASLTMSLLLFNSSMMNAGIYRGFSSRVKVPTNARTFSSQTATSATNAGQAEITQEVLNEVTG